jgi:hypothetical protein
MTSLFSLTAVLAMLLNLFVNVSFGVVNALIAIVRHGGHAAEEQKRRKSQSNNPKCPIDHGILLDP